MGIKREDCKGIPGLVGELGIETRVEVVDRLKPMKMK